MADTIDHDGLFKLLLRTFFYEFLELFLPEVAAYVDRESITFLDNEIFTDVKGGDRHIADLVAKARFRDREAYFLLHTEPMARVEAEFPRRMFQYFARLLEEHTLLVYPIALFSHDSPRRPEPDQFEVAFPDFTPLQFKYRVIQLNRLNWRDFIGRANPVASALMAKMNIAREDRANAKAECVRLLLSMDIDSARRQLISTFVSTYLRLNNAEERIFERRVAEFEPPQRELAMELLNEWQIKGIKKGRAEEAMLIALRQLRIKVGEPSKSQQTRIGRLTVEQLEELSEALLDFTTSGELDAWLAANAKQRRTKRA